MNANSAWKYIRVANRDGVTPWVFVDPYESDLNGIVTLHVRATREDADRDCQAMADDL